jgi:hypothetical protein
MTFAPKNRTGQRLVDYLFWPVLLMFMGWGISHMIGCSRQPPNNPPIATGGASPVVVVDASPPTIIDAGPLVIDGGVDAGVGPVDAGCGQDSNPPCIVIDDCFKADETLVKLQCKEATSPGGIPFMYSCRRALKNNMNWHPECIAKVTKCSQVKAAFRGCK